MIYAQKSYRSTETDEIVFVYDVKKDTVYYEDSKGNIQTPSFIYDFHDEFVPVN